MLWWVLLALAFLILLGHWRGPNAVWGSATAGVLIGLVIAVIQPGFDWWTIGMSLIVATFCGFAAEWLPLLIAPKGMHVAKGDKAATNQEHETPTGVIPDVGRRRENRSGDLLPHSRREGTPPDAPLPSSVRVTLGIGLRLVLISPILFAVFPPDVPTDDYVDRTAPNANLACPVEAPTATVAPAGLSLPPGWRRVPIPDVGTIDIPPEMEVKSEGLRVPSPSSNIQPPKVTIQQAGWNELQAHAAGLYFRLTVETEKAAPGTVAMLGSEIPLIEELKTLSAECYSKLPAEWRQNIIEIVPARIARLGIYPAILTGCKRNDASSSDGQVRVTKYIVPNYDRRHIVVVAYRESETELWMRSLPRVLSSLRVTNVRVCTVGHSTSWDDKYRPQKLPASSQSEPTGWAAEFTSRQGAKQAQLENLAREWYYDRLPRYTGVDKPPMYSGLDEWGVPLVPEDERHAFLRTLERTLANEPPLERGLGRTLAEGALGAAPQRVGLGVAGAAAEFLGLGDKDYQRFARQAYEIMYRGRCRNGIEVRP